MYLAIIFEQIVHWMFLIRKVIVCGLLVRAGDEGRKRGAPPRLMWLQSAAAFDSGLQLEMVLVTFLKLLRFITCSIFNSYWFWFLTDLHIGFLKYL